MAEKEERIAIAKMITGLDDDGSAQLDHFKIYSRYKIYSRKEATDKMAEAIIREDGEGISYLYAHGLAEAALDALLCK